LGRCGHVHSLAIDRRPRLGYSGGMNSLRSVLAVSLLSLGLAACGSAPDAGVDRPETFDPSDANDCGHDTWTTYAEAFVADHCGFCHRAFGAYEAVASQKGKVLEFVEVGKMPKGQPLDVDERARFVAWLRCELPR
jgi:hypothetical protein